jgi:cephalosporin hydroxylase
MINFKERITKKSNLEENDSISCYKNHCAQQTHNVYEVFHNFLQEVKPARILEIGTAAGGFTMFLSLTTEELGLQTKILSYDIHTPPWGYDELRSRGVEVNVKNVFIGEPWESVEQYVIDFIKQEGTTVVLCDGGWKIGEFRVLSKYLKPGDFILAHDYAENKEVFQEHIYKKIWNWMEVKYTDIQEYMETNRIVRYKAEEFQRCAWVAGVKE